jgi:hypothetical protein
VVAIYGCRATLRHQARTNRYGHELGCLTYIDETGKTQGLATSLLLHEDEDTFASVFEAFSKAFGADYVVAFTDSAITFAWPGTVLLPVHMYLVKENASIERSVRVININSAASSFIQLSVLLVLALGIHAEEGRYLGPWLVDPHRA